MWWRPGVIETDIHEPGRLERIAPHIPTGRVGTPHEVAEAILFLISDASSYTSGTILRVSGGTIRFRLGGALPMIPPGLRRAAESTCITGRIDDGCSSPGSQTWRAGSADL